MFFIVVELSMAGQADARGAFYTALEREVKLHTL